MKFSDPIEEGQFIKRYKRFFADIRQGDETLTAHCPNTGSMKGCLIPEAPCLYTVNDDPKRKLKYTLQMIKAPKSWIGVNTAISNSLVYEVWEQQKLDRWKNYKCAKREVKISDKSRIDMIMWENDKTYSMDEKFKPEHFKKATAKNYFHFIEVKNVSMVEGKRAMFPDAITTRGQKHIQELMDLMKKGHKCELVFTVQRKDCDHFSPADEIDPEYGKLLRQAHKKGLIISPYKCKLSSKGIELDVSEKLPLKF